MTCGPREHHRVTWKPNKATSFVRQFKVFISREAVRDFVEENSNLVFFGIGECL